MNCYTTLTQYCIGVLMTIAISYFITGSLFFGKTLLPEQEKQEEGRIPDKWFTKEELKQFKGENDSPVYLSIKGIVSNYT